MFEVLILAVALSMDAFAVSIGLGSKHEQRTSALAVKAAIYFGLFQALMPLIGFLGGKGVFGIIENYAHWIAFSLLLLIGAKMIYEAMSEGIEEDIAQITHRVMLVLAIATSIDAMAAGFTLTLIEINPLLACSLIGIITFIFSWFGVFIGAKSGTFLESKAEMLGGVILILIGFKVLLL
ncbi:manganese efflux pump MntP [Oleiphilus sp. HI0071]|jgi:putative Mn2+ efflux pump MntP|uniref:manganese efflux pump MntP n=1 Tax=unclassified Oleiphilus TaxID=2631174 RepID=UPI0007C2BF7B|nr:MULTISPECIES: manganese efflux pump MntP family protein [unclassified Oleiphilus]KZY67227.1 manganese efflux pump MntP [Oleiphilus sp. HI0065]KZY78955.1 manganese efflux pump MntP [Oleiphilus sp. HI0071]KZY91897.1 manganese efflux pump MntP [Oleiphilus sp. HI0073]KZZ49847.1 manganese efflux pump MntP [Oleiphilus sp. HI0118]KZZ57915.1 manganese efflux pump MntP [Oleiphilus sp. HI0122]KZZ70159.1 manganese efflux pump MntP [Oleiphilus sp. HI0130]KZZ81793.1 manganese efflux pump MntP [Oleiphi